MRSPTIRHAGAVRLRERERGMGAGAARRGGRRVLATLGDDRVLRVLSVATILAAWEIYGRSTNPVLFTYPTAVAQAGVEMTGDGTLPEAIGQSMAVLALGLALGTGIGIALGLLGGRSRVAAALMDIPTIALYATPMVAVVPLLVLWFGFGFEAKTVIVLLFAVFPILINTSRGVREVDPRLEEVAHAFCSPESRLWRDLILPSALPYIVTGIRLAIGRGLVGIVVAEFYTALAGLGFLIVSNANQFRTDKVMVPIIVLMALGVLLTKALEVAERRLSPWSRANAAQ
jgi:ABC-type nitrate/sulfonate/bicarbonate transport system permease component